MEEQQIYFLNQYEQKLQENILRACTSSNYLEGVMLETPDIDNKWKEIAPSYVADAIKEIASYPQVALGWAMYMGMAIAQMWDTDWEGYSKEPNLYEMVRDIRGFDYMDEVVRGEILRLDGDDYNKSENIVRQCSQMALDAIRHEMIEPQSPLAFHVYARSVKVLYRVGASIWLHQLGYKFTVKN